MTTIRTADNFITDVDIIIEQNRTFQRDKITKLIRQKKPGAEIPILIKIIPKSKFRGDN
jgi:hypothetical protein